MTHYQNQIVHIHIYFSNISSSLYVSIKSLKYHTIVLTRHFIRFVHVTRESC